MKLYIDHGGIEHCIECENWDTRNGNIIIFDKELHQIALIKDFAYVGEQPFDELLVSTKEEKPDESIEPPEFTTGPND
jgi:hypothetical protein